MRSYARPQSRATDAPRHSRGLARLAVQSIGHRPFLATAVGLAFAIMITLSACAPNNTPTSYDDATENSFMLSCTGDAPASGDTTTTLAGLAYCSCAYAVFAEHVPYNGDDQDSRVDDHGQLVFSAYSGKTYLEYNAELATDPNVLSDDIIAELDNCEAAPGSSDGNPTSAGGGSPAPR